MAEHIEYTTTGKPHPYHLVRPSIWPMASAFAGGFFALTMLLYFPGYKEGLAAGGTDLPFPWLPLLGALSIMVCMFFWWKDVIYESVIEKAHTKIAEIGLRFGMMLFIASEVMFFFAFFWAFFASAFFPGAGIGYVWPPEGTHIIPPFELPFLMTMILLLSGCTVTWAHHAILEGHNDQVAKALGLTVLLGVVFLCFQVYEYAHAGLGFTENVYTSAFFMATGFHGFHVFVGTVFLYVCWRRTKKGHFSPKHHFGFEAAAWYWHFVDVVWLFLFVAIYWWGNTIGVDHTGFFPDFVSGATAAAGH
ncbi:MAG: cytochrome c oxidase subunit 3 [Micavibrio sp.]|nr:cytochrome c oxidase subunit 3 [Micavibrio sp.]